MFRSTEIVVLPSSTVDSVVLYVNEYNYNKTVSDRLVLLRNEIKDSDKLVFSKSDVVDIIESVFAFADEIGGYPAIN